jgi:hypothetical protein
MLTSDDVLLAVDKLTQELEFLRYFYDAAGEAFGPADSDIYAMIKENYDGVLPEGY